jgi:hypothetical protein
LLQPATRWWRFCSELLHDDHVLVWGSAACCLVLVWIIFIALTTKCLNQSFYICWLKLNLQFLFLFEIFFIGILHLWRTAPQHFKVSFWSLIFFCSVGFHRQLDVWANYDVYFWCAVHVQVRYSFLLSIDEFWENVKV